jgi:error-prone DNA polymerase
MRHNGIDPEFAERVFEQIRGFGEYGFPESHAASFALIAYASAWLKRHYPSAFLCALLNAQPMGFYAPPTLIEDARRHGVEVRGVDVTRSHWDSTLEPGAGAHAFAVRVGFRYVKGMAEESADRLIAARDERAFTDLDDLVARSRLDRGSLMRLAVSGALDPFDPDRRHAFWEALGRQSTAQPELPTALDEERVDLDPLTELETIGWDYLATGHSPRGHPLVPLRGTLRGMGLPEAQELGSLRDGQRIRYVGVVICRQRPGTAKGVVFMTLEDETGFVNLVFWEKVFAKHRLLAKTLSLMGVTGRLQIEQGVVHLVVDEVWVPRLEERPAARRSRDFH